LLPSFESGVQESGRDASQLDRMIEVKISYDTDRNQALEGHSRFGRAGAPAESKATSTTPGDVAAGPRGRALRAPALVGLGHPEEHVEQLRPYLELGFTHLVFHHPGDDQSRFIKLYAEQILPRLRKEWG